MFTAIPCLPRRAAGLALLASVVALLASAIAPSPAAAELSEAECAAIAVDAEAAARGREAFEVCRPCHDVGDGAINRTGPLLNDLFGRRAGHLEDYPSSMPMVFAGERGLIWTDETLQEYLADPLKLVPGSEMPLIGVDGDAMAADLVAFLKLASAGCGDFNARPSAKNHSSAPLQ